MMGDAFASFTALLDNALQSSAKLEQVMQQPPPPGGGEEEVEGDHSRLAPFPAGLAAAAAVRPKFGSAAQNSAGATTTTKEKKRRREVNGVGGGRHRVVAAEKKRKKKKCQAAASSDQHIDDAGGGGTTKQRRGTENRNKEEDGGEKAGGAGDDIRSRRGASSSASGGSLPPILNVERMMLPSRDSSSSSSSSSSSGTAATHGCRVPELSSGEPEPDASRIIRQKKGHYSMRVYRKEIRTMVRFLQFVNRFYDCNGVIVAFTPEGLSCRGAAPGGGGHSPSSSSSSSSEAAPLLGGGANDQQRTHDYHYAFEARLRRSFFIHYECEKVVERSINISRLCASMMEIEKVVKKFDFLVLERSRDNILVRDDAYRAEILVPTLPARSLFPPALASHLDSVVYDHHLTIPAETFCQTMQKMVTSQVEDIEMAYYEGSHLLLRWNEADIPQRQSRFPIFVPPPPVAAEPPLPLLDGVAAAAADISGVATTVQPAPILMRETQTFDARNEENMKPAFCSWFGKALLMPMCCTGFNEYLQVAMQHQTPDGSTKEKIMLSMTIHTDPQSLSREDDSFIRMWVAPKHVHSDF